MRFLKVTLRFQNTTFDQEQIIQKDNRFSLSVCCERDMEMSKGTDIDFFLFFKRMFFLIVLYYKKFVIWDVPFLTVTFTNKI